MRFVLTLAMLAPLALADQITMKNGDRLSGKILKSDTKTLVLKSDLAGTVTIPWDAVTGVSSREPLYVGFRDGEVAVGSISTSGDKVEMVTRDAGAISARKDAIQYIRSEEEQKAYETQIDRYRNPRLVDLWTGFVDFGLANASGNARTSSLTVSANAARTTSRDKIQVDFTSLYASASTTGVSIVTANAMRGGIQYNLNITPKVFAFAQTNLEYDQFQELDLRFAPAGGAGWHVWKTDEGSLNLLAGVSLNREFFATGLNRTSAEALVGDEFTRRLSSVLTLTQRLLVNPNLTYRGDYRASFDMTAAAAVRRWLSVQMSFSDRLLSNPLPGRRKNDTLLSSGLRLTFK